MCALGKTDPYMSPSCCHLFVLWTWQLCPSTAIAGRTHHEQCCGCSGHHRDVSSWRRVLEHDPYPPCVEYGNSGFWGCGLQTMAQSPSTCCNTGFSLSRDTKLLVVLEQTAILSVRQAEFPSPHRGLGMRLARLHVWLLTKRGSRL